MIILTVRYVDWFPCIVVHDNSAFFEIIAWNLESHLNAFLHCTKQLSLRNQNIILTVYSVSNIVRYRVNAEQKGVISSHHHPFGIKNLHYLYKLRWYRI